MVDLSDTTSQMFYTSAEEIQRKLDYTRVVGDEQQQRRGMITEVGVC